MPYTLTFDYKKPNASHSEKTRNMSRDHVVGRLLGRTAQWVAEAKEHGEIKITITIVDQSAAK